MVTLNGLNTTASVQFKGGDNTFVLNAAQTGRTLTVATGAGNNQLTFNKVTKNSTVTVSGGSGSDQYDIGAVGGGANLTIDSTTGTNEIYVAGTEIASSATITLNAAKAGDNSLVFDPGYPAGTMSGVNADGAPNSGNHTYTAPISGVASALVSRDQAFDDVEDRNAGCDHADVGRCGSRRSCAQGPGDRATGFRG